MQSITELPFYELLIAGGEVWVGQRTRGCRGGTVSTMSCLGKNSTVMQKRRGQSTCTNTHHKNGMLTRRNVQNQLDYQTQAAALPSREPNSGVTCKREDAQCYG
jgi:hypothetical protein